MILLRIPFCNPPFMTYKIFIISVFTIFFTAQNAFASVDPTISVDPEKEDSKKKKSVKIVKSEGDDHLQKGFYLKDQFIMTEDTSKTDTPEVKKEKAEVKEEVQSFNFLYYILHSKLSDFATD